jgi:hypothetical protein
MSALAREHVSKMRTAYDKLQAGMSYLRVSKMEAEDAMDALFIATKDPQYFLNPLTQQEIRDMRKFFLELSAQLDRLTINA